MQRSKVIDGHFETLDTGTCAPIRCRSRRPRDSRMQIHGRCPNFRKENPSCGCLLRDASVRKKRQIAFLMLCAVIVKPAAALSPAVPFADDTFHACLQLNTHELRLLPIGKLSLDSLLTRLPIPEKIVSLSVTITRPRTTDSGAAPTFSVDPRNNVHVTTSEVDQAGHVHVVESQPYSVATATQREMIATLLSPKLTEVHSISVTERFTDDATDCGIELEVHTVRGPASEGVGQRRFECKPDGCVQLDR